MFHTLSGKSVIPKHLCFAIVVDFLPEMCRIPFCGRPESSSSIIWYVKPNARRLTHLAVLACDHAHSFTHKKGFSYQIIEEEYLGLPQQGILPISAKKTITMAIEVLGKKTLPNVHCVALVYLQFHGWTKQVGAIFISLFKNIFIDLKLGNPLTIQWFLTRAYQMKI